MRVEALIESAGTALLPKEQEPLRETAKSMREVDVPEKMRFRRIVLYIDDLDRCEPDKVIEVLQAVNMLLSFRLFVVIVAVDARWLSRSLETKYKDFFGAVPGENRVADNGAAHPVPGDVDGVGRATAADYLEKIFQVPYWVPSMTDTSSVTLVEDLVSPDHAADRKRRVPPGEETRDVPPAPPRPQPGVVEPEDDQHQVLSPPIRALGLTSNEIATLTTLAPFLGGSPRRARRFINVYRVAKASLAPDEIKKLEDGEYRALATHLAIATGAPNIFGAWATASCHSSKPVEERLSEIESDDRLGHFLIRNEEWENFRKALKAYEQTAGTDSQALQALANQAELAARFSFVAPHKAAGPKTRSLSE